MQGSRLRWFGHIQRRDSSVSERMLRLEERGQMKTKEEVQ